MTLFLTRVRSTSGKKCQWGQNFTLFCEKLQKWVEEKPLFSKSTCIYSFWSIWVRETWTFLHSFYFPSLIFTFLHSFFTFLHSFLTFLHSFFTFLHSFSKFEKNSFVMLFWPPDQYKYIIRTVSSLKIKVLF